MKFIDLKALAILSFIFAYAASAAFYPINTGMINQTTIVTTAAGTTTLEATGNQAFIAEGSTTQNIRFPSATLLPLDWWYKITNNSTGTLTVQDGSGATLTTITGGRIGEFVLKGRATSAGTWKMSVQPATGDIITDHGALTGLSDDDHPQYHNDARGDALYFRESEHIDSSVGAADAGKPIKLTGAGVISNSMLPSAAAGAWGITGNSALTAGTNFLGTTDAVDLVFKSNNTEYLRITSAGVIDSALGAGIAHFNASGILTSSAIDLSASDVTGVLPYAGGGTSASTAWTSGSVIFAGLSGFSQDNTNLFWDDNNDNLNLGAAAGNAGVLATLNVKAKSDTLGTHLQLEGPGTGGNRFLYINQRENGDMFFYNPGLGRVLFDYNAANNSLAIGQTGGNFQFQVTSTQPDTSPATPPAIGNMAISNGDTTDGNYSGLLFQGSQSGLNPDSAIYGIHDDHNGASSSGSQEFWVRDTGAFARAMRIASNKVITLDAYGTGILHSSSAGLISSSAVNLAGADVTGVLPNANTTATSSSTADTIVLRDGSGNFSAGTITAALTGNASTASALAANPSDCSANQFASAIAANGDLTCSQPAFSTLSGAPTVTQSTIANVALTTCTTARTIDWGQSNSFTLPLTSGSTCAVTFSNPTSGQVITVDYSQPATTGSNAVVTHSSTVLWAGGVPPTITTGSSKTDSCTYKYNGTDYRGSCVQDMRAP